MYDDERDYAEAATRAATETDPLSALVAALPEPTPEPMDPFSWSFPGPDETVRDAVVRNMIHYKVCRDIFCPVTGQVLDVRTVVSVVGGPDGDDVLVVMSPDAWRELGDTYSPSGPVTIWFGTAEQAELAR